MILVNGIIVQMFYKVMCVFILVMFCKGFKLGQVVCNLIDIMKYCLYYVIYFEDLLLWQWLCFCISQLWRDFLEVKWWGICENVYFKLVFLIKDLFFEVCVVMVYVMIIFFGIFDFIDEVVRIEEGIVWIMFELVIDGSLIVCKELFVFFFKFVLWYENKFLVVVYE